MPNKIIAELDLDLDEHADDEPEHFDFTSPEDVIIEREVVTDWPVASAGPFVVALDPMMTPTLAQEELAHELVNRVQRLRKDAGFAVSARIALSLTVLILL